MKTLSNTEVGLKKALRVAYKQKRVAVLKRFQKVLRKSSAMEYFYKIKSKKYTTADVFLEISSNFPEQLF